MNQGMYRRNRSYSRRREAGHAEDCKTKQAEVVVSFKHTQTITLVLSG